MMKIDIKKSTVCILIMITTIMCFSCKKNEVIEKSSDEAVVNDDKVVINDDNSMNGNEFKVENIDLSDVINENERDTLYRIDELNHELGEIVYLTKEDYYKYRDVQVSLVGDSIADFSLSQLKKYFTRLHQDAVPGREMVDGIEAFDNMKNMNRLGDIFILSLGNNATRGIELDVLSHVHDGLNGRPLIIPTIVMPYYGQERNRNRELINFVNTHDNCYLADWNKVARMGEDFITEDGVHPTGNGSYAYAQLMLKTVVDIMDKVDK